MLCGARNLDYCNENYQNNLQTSFLRMCDLSHTANFDAGIQNGLITAVDNIFVHNEGLNLCFASAIVNDCIRPCLHSFLQLIIFWQWQT